MTSQTARQKSRNNANTYIAFEIEPEISDIKFAADALTIGCKDNVGSW